MSRSAERSSTHLCKECGSPSRWEHVHANLTPVSPSLAGQYCTEDVDECQLMPNACQNGGTCHNNHGGYNCVCVNGWTGEDCSENIDDCAMAACFQGATCHDRVASFYCECPHGRTGERRPRCSGCGVVAPRASPGRGLGAWQLVPSTLTCACCSLPRFAVPPG